jgi:hypothetical protein
MLLQIMEDFLKEAPKTADYDSVRQSVVILMGKLAKDMDKDSTKVKSILGQLIATLNTPSQQVNKRKQIFWFFHKFNLGSSGCCRLSSTISTSN